MQAIGRQHQRAPDGAPVHYERHRPKQTMLYRLVQQYADRFIAHTEASTGAELPRFIKDEFDAFLECGILAHGFLRLRCSECGHGKRLASSCKRRGFCSSCGARRTPQTAAHFVDPVIAHMPVRQWVLSLPMLVVPQGLPMRKSLCPLFRASKTSGCLLHCVPEAFVGSPLALEKTGDRIHVDVPARRIHLEIDDADLSARRAAWTPPSPRYGRGYGWMFSRHILQADQGCDFDFLEIAFGAPVAEPDIF